MDLHILTPCQTEIRYDNRLSCNGTLDTDDQTGTGPENVVWETAAPSGTYLICPVAYSRAVVGATYTLIIFRDGAEVYQTTGTRDGTDYSDVCSASYPGVVTYIIP
jgi:uncharacterized protein YfaP (DUF2135 family)